MQQEFKIGCSGFYNRHWKKIFYPENMPQSKWLNFYCEHFKTLELNVTFYRFPTEKTFQGWYNKSPDDFLFSVKAPRLITHLKKFNDCTRFISDFYLTCEKGLKEKLGCVLFQLPPNIHYSEEKLEKIADSLDPAFNNVIEFRHPSWWNEDVYKYLEERNLIFCSVSHPKLPEDIITTTQTAYIRLHGKPEMFYSDYSHKFLKDLADNVLKNEKTKEAFIYFNNTAGTAGILNALELQKMITILSHSTL